MATISWEDFNKVDLRVGTIIRVENFSEAHKPAYKIWVDLGSELGVRKSSAQLTSLYNKEDLLHKQVICVVNFPKKQIGPFLSEILITGFANENGDIILATVEQKAPNGSKLH